MMNNAVKKFLKQFPNPNQADIDNAAQRLGVNPAEFEFMVQREMQKQAKLEQHIPSKTDLSLPTSSNEKTSDITIPDDKNDVEPQLGKPQDIKKRIREKYGLDDKKILIESLAEKFAAYKASGEILKRLVNKFGAEKVVASIFGKFGKMVRPLDKKGNEIYELMFDSLKRRNIEEFSHALIKMNGYLGRIKGNAAELLHSLGTHLYLLIRSKPILFKGVLGYIQESDEPLNSPNRPINSSNVSSKGSANIKEIIKWYKNLAREAINNESYRIKALGKKLFGAVKKGNLTYAERIKIQLLNSMKKIFPHKKYITLEQSEPRRNNMSVLLESEDKKLIARYYNKFKNDQHIKKTIDQLPIQERDKWLKTMAGAYYHFKHNKKLSDKASEQKAAMVSWSRTPDKYKKGNTSNKKLILEAVDEKVIASYYKKFKNNKHTKKMIDQLPADERKKFLRIMAGSYYYFKHNKKLSDDEAEKRASKVSWSKISDKYKKGNTSNKKLILEAGILGGVLQKIGNFLQKNIKHAKTAQEAKTVNALAEVITGTRPLGVKILAAKKAVRIPWVTKAINKSKDMLDKLKHLKIKLHVDFSGKGAKVTKDALGRTVIKRGYENDDYLSWLEEDEGLLEISISKTAPKVYEIYKDFKTLLNNRIFRKKAGIDYVKNLKYRAMKLKQLVKEAAKHKSPTSIHDIDRSLVGHEFRTSLYHSLDAIVKSGLGSKIPKPVLDKIIKLRDAAPIKAIKDMAKSPVKYENDDYLSWLEEDEEEVEGFHIPIVDDLDDADKKISGKKDDEEGMILEGDQFGPFDYTDQDVNLRYINKFEEMIKKHSNVKTGKPVTEKQIMEAEEKLQVSFSDPLKTFLLKYGTVEIDGVKSYPLFSDKPGEKCICMQTMKAKIPPKMSWVPFRCILPEKMVAFMPYRKHAGSTSGDCMLVVDERGLLFVYDPSGSNNNLGVYTIPGYERHQNMFTYLAAYIHDANSEQREIGTYHKQVEFMNRYLDRVLLDKKQMEKSENYKMLTSALIECAIDTYKDLGLAIKKELDIDAALDYAEILVNSPAYKNMYLKHYKISEEKQFDTVLNSVMLDSFFMGYMVDTKENMNMKFDQEETNLLIPSYAGNYKLTRKLLIKEVN